MTNLLDTDAQLDMSLDALIATKGRASKNRAQVFSGSGKVRSSSRADRRQETAPYARDHLLKTTGSLPNRLYVGNLAWGVTWKELKDHMKQAGRVVKADVATDPAGRSKVSCSSDPFADTLVFDWRFPTILIGRFLITILKHVISIQRFQRNSHLVVTILLLVSLSNMWPSSNMVSSVCRMVYPHPYYPHVKSKGLFSKHWVFCRRLLMVVTQYLAEEIYSSLRVCVPRARKEQGHVVVMNGYCGCP